MKNWRYEGKGDRMMCALIFSKKGSFSSPEIIKRLNFHILNTKQSRNRHFSAISTKNRNNYLHDVFHPSMIPFFRRLYFFSHS